MKLISSRVCGGTEESYDATNLYLDSICFMISSSFIPLLRNRCSVDLCFSHSLKEGGFVSAGGIATFGRGLVTLRAGSHIPKFGVLKRYPNK